MARPPPSTPPRRSRTAVAPVRASSVVATDWGSLPNAFSSYFPYASSSSDPARFLLSLASLQAWVYRPDAVAKCFISDVLKLRALRSDDGDVQYKSSDVFLLNHFPCKNVEIYGWVAGVEHKDDTVILTLDDGDGENTLPVHVRLAKVAAEQPPLSKAVKLAVPTPASPTKTGTFRSARERKAARKAAAAAQAKVEEAAAAAAAAKRVWQPAEKVYVRPDIRIGDTVRVVGHLNEYSFNKPFGPAEVIRKVVVDAASGSGSFEVVDPERHYYHHAEVVELHETRYSRPFVMPAPPVPSSARSSPARSMRSSPARSMRPSPAKSILSFIGSSDAGDYSDEEEEEDAFDRQLGDPTKLPSKLLTDTTFRLYALDHMTKTTVRAMKAATQRCNPYYPPIPVLQSLFPEYAAATKSKSVPFPPKRDVFGPLPVQQLPTPSSSGDETMETPRATFHSKRKREAGAAASPTKTPVASTLFRSRSQRERDGRDHDRSEFSYDQSVLSSLSSDLLPSQPSLSPFTPQSLLDVPALHALATRIVDNTARQNEIARRRRAETGTQTPADLQVVAKRKAAGRNSGSYALTREERADKMLTLATATIRQVHRDGGVVAVEQGYLPLPPEMLAPLLAPVVSEARDVREMKHQASGIFRSGRERELERQRDWGAASSSHASLCRSSTGGSSLGSMSLYSTAGASAPSARRVAARLSRWCERWERVSVDAVERALAWGDESGVL